MTATPEENLNPQPAENDDSAADLLQALRRKEGIWVEWGRACQQLQKMGYSPQRIFEETGFEPIQQNQIIVASQVYSSMLSVGIDENVRSRFEQTGSDTLYEFRILTQPERAAAAKLVVDKGIDSEGAREVAKAMKDFSRLSVPPAGFSSDSGDAVAYYYWKLARQNSDLQARSRLIAQALRFANSETARQQVESLLTDFTVTRNRPAPLLPVYRLDSEEQLPRVLPVVGKLPLSTTDLQAVPLVEAEGGFGLVKFSGTGAWVPVPGWQVILNAVDPIVLLTDSDQLPNPLPGKLEEVLVVVDRAQRQWNPDSYFLLDQDGQIHLQWSNDPPEMPVLGQVILVMRPKRILDENFTKDPWQIDE
jgi:Rubisco Assembly chaperone C-terminal domain/Rubisco accumulation factor 1 alpha helical domain/Rubisco accumulation factor 1 helix turn helix domain